jgi:CHAD domain-containing protein
MTLPAPQDTYRLDLTLPPGEAARQVALAESTRIVATVADARYTMGARIHELRKHTKRMRALFRLIRRGFPDFKEANVSLRDLARLVTSHRDARVMADLTRHLGKAPASNPVCAWFDYRAALAEKLAEDRVIEIVQHIETTLVDLDRWRFAEVSRADVLGGFSRTYGVVIEHRELVHDKSDSEAAHEWRKFCKDHWYHLQLLHDALPAKDRTRIAALDDLGDHLGQVHDRDVLLQHLTALPEFLRETRQARAIGKSARRERKALQASAQALADTLLHDNAAKLTARLRRKWRAASADTT